MDNKQKKNKKEHKKKMLNSFNISPLDPQKDPLMSKTFTSLKFAMKENKTIIFTNKRKTSTAMETIQG